MTTSARSTPRSPASAPGRRGGRRRARSSRSRGPRERRSRRRTPCSPRSRRCRSRPRAAILLADGVERWSAAQAKPVAAALAIAAARSHDRACRPRALAEARGAEGTRRCGRHAGGEVRSATRAQGPRPAVASVAEAGRRGFALDPEAAPLLVERMGESTLRLADRARPACAVGRSGAAGHGRRPRVDDRRHVRGGRVGALGRDRRPRSARRAAAAASRLSGQGESVTPLVYQVAKRFREARLALAGLDAGAAARELEARCRCTPTPRRCSCGA